jgi:hypothetical protein
MFSKIRQLVMRQFTVCPRTGNITGLKIEARKAFWLWIVLGLASIIWVLIRVVPKPSRATYPCQKVAQPLAAGFIVWLLGLVGSSLIIQRARRLFQRHRYVVGVICLAPAVLLSFITLNDTSGIASPVGTFAPTDSSNSPMGIAHGINPGRVVWVYDSLLSDQGGTSGWWWEDKRTDPKVAQRMMNQALLNLTGINDPVKSWDSLFKYFNKTRYNQNDVGYKAGDKIAIKVNNIFSRFYQWTDSQDGRPCPQMLYAMLWQLVHMAGVPDKDITIYDCNFYHGDPVYKYCHTDFPGVRWAEGDATDRADGHNYEKGPGSDPGIREKVVPDTNCVIYYGDPNLVPGSGTVCLPTVVSKARYLINICLPRNHELAGVTLCAKNFFGSVWHPNPPPGNAYYYHGWCPFFMHKAVASLNFAADIPMRPMGTYNALVDLMGHKDLGGKTFLFIGECIRPKYWSAPPFKGRPASSLFMSQDIVAIESVMLDFLQSAGVVPAGTPDNYLHEAAQANNPPSGTVYDPEHDGIRLQSLGVHEHWNNPTDKQYSRNLGTGKGIELIQILNKTVTVVEHSNSDIPETFALYANYPNPFNPSTKIRYAIPENNYLTLKVFDLRGREIVTLVNEKKASGNYEVTFNASNLSSGTYFYQLKTENFIQTKKMTLLR